MVDGSWGWHNDIWLISLWVGPDHRAITPVTKKNIIKHFIIMIFQTILQTWTTGEYTQDLSQTDTGTVLCRGDAEKAGNFVCQTPTVSPMMRCWLHSPPDTSPKKEAFREENGCRKHGYSLRKSSAHRMQRGGGGNEGAFEQLCRRQLYGQVHSRGRRCDWL